MKALLLVLAVVLVGCGKKDAPKAAPEKLIADLLVEDLVRRVSNKPTGELTKADLEKVTHFQLSVPLTNMTDLEKLTQLTILSLDDNKLTDVKGIEKLAQLKTLGLYNNKLTDVRGLANLTQLAMLLLDNNQLTDVKGLENLTQLKELRLYNNPDLTKAQIAEPQKALPKCQISHNPTK